MNTLKISVLRRISCFNQSLKSCFHQRTNTAAKYGLLTEQVCLCLYFESGLQNSCSRATQSTCISQRFVFCFSCIVLFNSNQTRGSSSNLILASHCMAWCFWRDHCDIHILRRFDLSKMNGKAMREHQHIALFQIWFNGFFVKLRLFLIIDQNHDDVSFLSSFCCCIYFKSLFLGFFPRSASLIKTYNDIASGIFQVLRMCMSLTAITDNRDGLSFQKAHVTVFLVIDFYCHFTFLPYINIYR